MPDTSDLTSADGPLGGVHTGWLDIAQTKSSLGFIEALVLGILANVLVCLAVWLCLAARTVTDKIVAIVGPITAFVAAGFEHSIANMYFLPLGIFVKRWATPGFWGAVHSQPTDYPSIGWGHFLVSNLLPVTIGNVIGGGGMVGLVYWFIYLRPKRTGVVPPASPKPEPD